MIVELYSTHCPRCDVLEAKLKQKEIQYVINTDVDEMLAQGIQSVPALRVGTEILDFASAVKWLNSQEG